MSIIKINTDDFEKFSIKIHTISEDTKLKVQTEISKSTLKIMREARENIKRNGSVVTGKLRLSVVDSIGDLEGEVHTSNLNYAIYVEKGTKAHIIRPKNKKALYWAGAPYPVKQVNHPGSKAKPYLQPAFEKEKPIFLKNLKQATKF